MKKKLITILFSALMLVSTAGVMAACDFGGMGGTESSVEKTTAVVHFDVNTTLQTNSVKDKTVTIGKRVSKPTAVILEDNPTNLQVYGWYTSPDFTEQWDFKKGKVEGDMTLYAKWVELYDIDYYVNGKFTVTENVFKGDYLVEDATLVEGFKYYGTYIDEAHTQAWDFTSPVQGNMKVYVKRSEGIYLSDHTDEGELSSSTLTENVTAYLGTLGEKDEEGWVEEYTVNTVYETGVVEEKCTYVNFGYTPTVGDGYIELCRSFDITQSQIIRIWYKNLGNADSMCMYFTTLMDPENNVYSETGMNYTQNFCYPNYVGNDSARLFVETNMDETDEWACVEFNLYEIYKHGYSIWGTSPYLGSLRLQANYKSNPDEKDFSNVFLIKAIEGVPYDVKVEDSEEVRTTIDTAKGLDASVIEGVANNQTANANGFVFPKDFASVQSVTSNAQVVNDVNGLLFRADDEVVGRETGEKNSGFTITAGDKAIDLSENTTLSITLKNYGYASSLILYIYNQDNVAVKAELDIATRMMESKNYMVNLYGAFGMEGLVKKVEIYYSSVGVDNLICFEEIAFEAFMPYDTVGINLNDKYAYGFSSTDKVAIDFVSDRSGTRFDVLESGASVTTAEKTYAATTDGYANATLNYILDKNSEVTKVIVEYKINGAFTTPYEYELNLENKGKANAVTVPFNANERGYVEALRFTFIGTGKIIIQGIDYTVGETGLPFYKSYENIYNGAYSDWVGGGQYAYDEALKASLLVRGKNSTMSSLSLYIGFVKNNTHLVVPHTTYSVLTTSSTKVKIVYQNRTDVAELLVQAQFSKLNTGTSESAAGPDYPILGENQMWEIDSNMAEYEWSTLTIEVPSMYVDLYLAKIRVGFTGNEIAIRAISIEA